MTPTPSPSPSSAAGPALAERLRYRFRTAMTRRERLYPYFLIRWWAILLLKTAGPVILAVLVANLLFQEPAADLAPSAAEVEQAAGALREARRDLFGKVTDAEHKTLAELGAALDAMIAESPPPTEPADDATPAPEDAAAKAARDAGAPQPQPPPAVAELLERLDDLGTVREEAFRDTALVKEHERYQARGYFFAGFVLIVLLLLGYLTAQVRLARRYWVSMFHDFTPADPGPDDPLQGLLKGFAAMILAGVPLLALLGWLAQPESAMLSMVALVAVAIWIVLLILKRNHHDMPPPQNLRAAPRKVLFFTLWATLPLAFGLALGMDLPGALDDSATATERVYVVLLATAGFLLFLSTVVMTAFMTETISREFPEVGDVNAIGADVVTPQRWAHQIAPDLWAMLERDTAERIVKPPQSDDSAKPTPLSYDEDAIRETFPALPVHSLMSASHADEAIREVALPMAVTMVLTLVAISLGLDVFEAGGSGPEALRSARAASHDVWLLTLGASFSTALVVVLVAPLVRVHVFAAEPAEPPAPKQQAATPRRSVWTGWMKPGFRSSEFEVTEAPVPEPAPAPPDALVDRLSRHRDAASEPLEPEAREAVLVGNRKGKEMRHVTVLRRHIGANEAKFATVLGGTQYGGAMQSLLEENLKTQAVRIATLLSPALAGTLLGVLG